MRTYQLSSSFILNIKWVNGKLHITLQNIKTRQSIMFFSWDVFFQELRDMAKKTGPDQSDR
jgi:hypothetical protein